MVCRSAINSFDSQAVISGNGAAQNIQGMMKCVTSGFYTTATNYIGQNAGAKNYKRVRKVLFSCLACSASIVITISFIVYGLNKPILGLYITDNPDAIQYGIIRMTYMTLPYFLLGLMDVATGALRGLGYSFVPMIISLMGACGLRILWIPNPQVSHAPCFISDLSCQLVLNFLCKLRSLPVSFAKETKI